VVIKINPRKSIEIKNCSLYRNLGTLLFLYSFFFYFFSGIIAVVGVVRGYYTTGYHCLQYLLYRLTEFGANYYYAKSGPLLIFFEGLNRISMIVNGEPNNDPFNTNVLIHQFSYNDGNISPPVVCMLVRVGPYNIGLLSIENALEIWKLE